MKLPLPRQLDTLLGRTALVLIVTLVASHFAVFGLFRFFHASELHQQFAEQLLAAVETQRAEYQRLTPAQRQALLTQGTGSLSLTLPEGVRVQQNEMEKAISEELSRKLGSETWLGHSGHHEGPRGDHPSPPRPEGGEGPRPPEMDGAGRPSQDFGPPPPRPGDRGGIRPREGFGPDARGPGGPRLWLHFTLDGRQVWFSQRFPWPDRGASDNRWLMQLVMVMVILALAGTLALLWPIYRPLRRLAAAHTAVGEGQAPQPLPEQGPREVVRLTRSFNSMVSNLATLEEERRTLLAGVSHDLRTPLARLRMRLALLDDVDISAYERDLDDIQRITEQFLAYVRGEADEAEREEIDVGILLGEVAERYGHAAVSIGSTSEGPVLVADRLALLRSLCNLIDNALAHGKPPVELRAQHADGFWLLSVRDHGQGLPPEALASARRAFHRLDPARQGHGHCGLGLAIAERVAKRHGGELVLTNADGGGLIASLKLKAG
ncbi:ATP-binding protein [Chitinimonas sp.]|uniref:ATP-binding protein n=1 Tax=Chitinimonas sp. TaxID=1934313 RepID=UPI002F92CBB6